MHLSKPLLFYVLAGLRYTGKVQFGMNLLICQLFQVVWPVISRVVVLVVDNFAALNRVMWVCFIPCNMGPHHFANSVVAVCPKPSAFIVRMLFSWATNTGADFNGHATRRAIGAGSAAVLRCWPLGGFYANKGDSTYLACRHVFHDLILPESRSPYHVMEVRY